MRGTTVVVFMTCLEMMGGGGGAAEFIQILFLEEIKESQFTTCFEICQQDIKI